MHVSIFIVFVVNVIIIVCRFLLSAPRLITLHNGGITDECVASGLEQF